MYRYYSGFEKEWERDKNEKYLNKINLLAWAMEIYTEYRLDATYSRTFYVSLLCNCIYLLMYWNKVNIRFILILILPFLMFVGLKSYHDLSLKI